MSDVAQDTIINFLAATRRAIDPHRGLLAASTPYVVAGGVGPARREVLIAGMVAADGADADYLHLEFAPGREEEGPANVAFGSMRGSVGHLRPTCRFWLGEDRRMLLVASVGDQRATMGFAPDGADSRPGDPPGELEEGYARAAALLRQVATDLSLRRRNYATQPARAA